LRRSFGDKPEEARYHFLKGNALFEMKHTDKAIDAYSTAIDNQPESPLYYYGRGQAYLANGEEEKALADLEKSKVLDDTNTILIQEQMDRTKIN